jgi:hypothetical protein
MRCWWLVFVVGCSNSSEPEPVCYGGELCFETEPPFAPHTLSGVIDTSTAPCVANLTPFACVLTADAFVITERVTIVGARPLVLLARDAIRVEVGGVLDASSHGTIVGAGARSCVPEEPRVRGNGGSMGGAGGAFDEPMKRWVSAFSGGCDGVAGHADFPGPGTVQAGHAGGGIALFAPTVIVDGIINASGAGGAGCETITDRHYSCLAGGGGSGGMIDIDTDALSGHGTLIANGGGGGGGNGGVHGNNPDETTPLAPAHGQPIPSEPTGGDGAAGSVLAGTRGADFTFGFVPIHGGGGGGAGVIRIAGDVAGFTGIVSPTARQ